MSNQYRGSSLWPLQYALRSIRGNSLKSIGIVLILASGVSLAPAVMTWTATGIRIALDEYIDDSNTIIYDQTYETACMSQTFYAQCLTTCGQSEQCIDDCYRQYECKEVVACETPSIDGTCGVKKATINFNENVLVMSFNPVTGQLDRENIGTFNGQEIKRIKDQKGYLSQGSFS